MPRLPEVVDVDRAGLLLGDSDDVLLDVLLDGRRVWSLWTERVAGRTPSPSGPPGAVAVPWPRELAQALDGPVRMTVSCGETVLLDREVVMGPGPDRVRLVDREGRDLVVDNHGRLAVAFGDQGEEATALLLDATARLLADLEEAGVEPFVAYGTLLGAVREGSFVGHDNDVDLAYLSSHEHPVDVILESYRVQRHLIRAGHDTTRYSGAAFRVDLTVSDGTRRTIDVFAGALVEGHLMLMGELWVPYDRSALLPRTSVVLEGRSLPAPADPEALLAATYGPSWRRPDPAFAYAPPAATTRRLDGWFRGTRAARNHWDRRYSDAVHHGPVRKPHDLARLLHRRETEDCEVVDVGCGRGQDAVWLARRGHPVLGLDFSPNGFARLHARSQEEGWGADFASMNLLELRQVMLWGARLARREGPRAVLARHVADATSDRGRRHLWRLAAMALSGGGRLYLEFVLPPADPPLPQHLLLHGLDPDQVRSEVLARGARVVEEAAVDVTHTGQPPAGGIEDETPLRGYRMVMEWRA